MPLVFEGLHSDQKTGNGYGKMGHCALEEVFYPFKQKIANISLNHLYLLNKLGHSKYFTSNPKISDDYSYIDIIFDKMIDTCSHEITHYIQLVKWGKSSCESDLILSNGNYNEELAREHEEFTQEIYQLIKNSAEYSEWERRWNEIEQF